MTNANSPNYARVLTIGVMLLSFSSVVFFPPQEAEAKITDKLEFTIATWYIPDFGTTSIEKETDAIILQAISDVIMDFDIIFLQGLVSIGATADQNHPYTAFNNLCSKIHNDEGFNLVCKSVGHVGFGSEGYGIIVYQDEIRMTSSSIRVSNSDTGPSDPYFPRGTGAGQIKYPPMKTVLHFNAGKYKMTVYNVHTSVTQTPKEIGVLSSILTTNLKNSVNDMNYIILGNFHAGSTNYPAGLDNNPNAFRQDRGWVQTVNDADVTTFVTNQADDRMILTRALSTGSYYGYDIIDRIANPSILYFTNRPFNDIHVSGNATKPILTDHKLVWAEFNYGGAESTANNGTPKEIFVDFTNPPTCNVPDIIYARGEGFIPNETMNIYLTDYTTNQNIQAKFKEIGESFVLTDVTNNVTQITTDGNGNIPNTILWQNPVGGTYNVIVDVNRDGKFTNSIDVIDEFGQSGLMVTVCQERGETLSVMINVDKITRDVTSSNSPNIEGSNLDGGNPSKARKIHAGSYASDIRAGGYFSLSSSVFSSDVQITSAGVFDRTITWNNPPPGFYNIILDMDNDNTYTPGVDIVDYTDEIGFVVVSSRAGHNDIVHLGDNGLEREVYNTKIAKNIYTLAKNLPADTDVDIYTISEKQLKADTPGFTTWENVNGFITITPYATPVYEFGLKKYTAHTSTDGTLFLSTWKNPSQIFDQDFINYYGKKFNVIIDVDQNGRFNPNIDKVDTHDIGDMTNWFSDNDVLDSSANGNPAVSEYKEYLNAKLNLAEHLDSANIYNDATKRASFKYLCSVDPTTDLFEIIKVGAQVGFRVLEEDEYYTEKDVNTGRFVYDNVDFDSLDVDDGTRAVIIGLEGGQMIIDNFDTGNNARTSICQAFDVIIKNMRTGEDSSVNISAVKITLEGDNETKDTCIRYKDNVYMNAPSRAEQLGNALSSSGSHFYGPKTSFHHMPTHNTAEYDAAHNTCNAN